MEYSCKDFKVGKCEGQKVVDGETMPLVLQPPEPEKGNLESLLVAIKKNKDWFEEMIIKNSAVLLRGFNLGSAEEFNEIVDTFGWDDIRYVGPAPRTHVYKRVWTANEGPLSEFIYYHHEMVLVSYADHLAFLGCVFSSLDLLPGGVLCGIGVMEFSDLVNRRFLLVVENMFKSH